MDVTQWYSIVVGAIIALFILACLLLLLIKLFRTYAPFFFLKHVLYPQIPRNYRISAKTTRLDVLLLVIFLTGNLLCIFIGIGDISEAMKRAGLMSVINLIPLPLGTQKNPIASWCRVSTGPFSRIHRWLGVVAMTEGLVHAIAAAISQLPGLYSQRDITSLMAAIIMAIVLLSSIPPIRRYAYEIFLKFHQILTGVAAAAVSVHISSQGLLTWPKICLTAAIGLQVLMVILQLCQVVYRNVKPHKSLSRATIRTITFKGQDQSNIPVSDAVHVRVRLPRPWKPRAGQYVYLCIPGTARASFAQWHPFYISWWYLDTNGNDTVVFIVQRRKGFTKDLFLHANSDRTPDPGMRAIIDGPYGHELDLKAYGTVLLFATGIGIAAQLPYVARLLEGYRNCEVKTRRIALFWEMECEVHAAWVADMMMELLNRDFDKILDIQLFVVGSYISEDTRRGDVTSLGERINRTYDCMPAGRLIESEIEDRRGHTVVSLCTNDDTSDEIRETVRQRLDKDIHLKELDFRPYSAQTQKNKLKHATSIGGSKPRTEFV